MAIKNIQLSGAEISVTGLNGTNASIRNDGTDVIYVAKKPGITPGADDVLPIPAGGAAVILDISGKLFMTGTGKVLIMSSDRAEIPFSGSCCPAPEYNEILAAHEERIAALEARVSVIEEERRHNHKKPRW